jgi:hypothetical protein
MFWREAAFSVASRYNATRNMQARLNLVSKTILLAFQGAL